MSGTSPEKQKQTAKKTVKEIMQALAAPFDEEQVHFKPAMVSGNRAMALAYVDARAIQDRLDAVLGGEGWQDNYKCLEDGSVVCRLRLRLGDEWITKMDVGSPSEQPDGGDRRKAAFSDALKRAAVKFGIGRYLYRIPTLWADYDPAKRRFVQTPKLPANARAAKPAPTPKAQARPATHTLPANGAELQRRLYDHDARLAAQGVCPQGALVKHVVEAGVKAGYDADLATWTEAAILLAAEETRAFENRARQVA